MPPVQPPVPKKSNFSTTALLKTAIVPIRVTESSARMCTEKGDYGDHIFHHAGSIYYYAVASIWEHDG